MGKWSQDREFVISMMAETRSSSISAMAATVFVRRSGKDRMTGLRPQLRKSGADKTNRRRDRHDQDTTGLGRGRADPRLSIDYRDPAATDDRHDRRQ